MILTETGIQAHSYLFVVGIVSLIMFLVYVYICEHKTNIEGNGVWEDIFQHIGMTPTQISELSHDDTTWYYQKISTCVAYNENFSGRCQKHESFCAGGEFFGDVLTQAKAVKLAIDKGGEHPSCPLIYPGTD
uniref:Uncharacterized protein n=1 Tax=Marseillevirus LCMAC102 TaxID=2506603 RepID=A0A481YTG3_9VIRU|nr:MAG: hypothetical protein LCMAC102_00950 [Marseillevirus LCMAC102]